MFFRNFLRAAPFFLTLFLLFQPIVQPGLFAREIPATQPAPVPAPVQGTLFPEKMAGPQNQEERALLLAFFGSNLSSAYPNEALLQKLRGLQPGLKIYPALTAHSIVNARRVQESGIYSVQEAMAGMGTLGWKKLTVLSLHVVPGQEYAQLGEIARRFQGMPKGLEEINLALPLLASLQDGRELAKGLVAALPADRKPSDAVIFIGHGSPEKQGNMAYTMLQHCLDKEGPNLFVSTLEGDVEFADTLAELQAKGLKKAYVVPLLLVLGDHAQNDLFGPEPESWVKKLEAAGIAAVPIKRGLGELDVVNAIFARHAVEALGNR